MSVHSNYRSSFSLLKFAFKKYPLEMRVNSALVRTLHSNTLGDRSKVKSPKSNLVPNPSDALSDLIKAAYHLKSSDNHINKPKSYDRNYISEERAINEYLLEPQELHGLRMTVSILIDLFIRGSK